MLNRGRTSNKPAHYLPRLRLLLCTGLLTTKRPLDQLRLYTPDSDKAKNSPWLLDIGT